MPRAKTEEKLELPQEGPPEGIAQSLLHRLSLFTAALDSTAETAALREQPRRTPKDFSWEELFPGSTQSPGVTANDRALFAAVALVDAVELRCPGTDEGRAVSLCEDLFERQRRLGFMEGELLTSSHGQLWDGAMAAILFVAHRRKIQGLSGTAATWWRQRLDLWREHVTPLNTILVPCVRGGHLKNPGLACNVSNDAIFAYIEKGRSRRIPDGNRYMTGLRLFQAMPDIPLPQPPEPWPLSYRLIRRRYPDGWVSVLQGLDGRDTQPMVGTTSWRPAGAVEVPGGWALLGEVPGPVPAPAEGWTEEKDFGSIYGVLTPAAHDGEPEAEEPDPS